MPTFGFLETLGQDIRYGFRQLRRNPGFTAVAVVTLALGIGVNTALFSVLNGIFLRPLPVRDPGQLVELAFGQRGAFGEFNFSYPDFRDIREQDSSFTGMLAYRVGFDGLSDGRSVGRVTASFVTGNYFTLLGLKPARGRLILPSEGNISGSNPVLVLGYDYWKSRFTGNPDVIGKQVSVDGRAMTIVGVAPKGFRGLLSIVEMQAYLPLNMAGLMGRGTRWFTERDTHDLFVLARLKRGQSVDQAQAALDVIAGRLSREHPKTDAGATPRVFPQREARLSPQPQPGHYNREMVAFGLFLGLAILLLLLACFNVANILLVRATAREHEMAVRSALGAGRGRVSRQVLTESLLLAFLGGGAGIVLGIWASAVLSTIHFNIGIPYQLDFGFDWRVAAYTIAAIIAAGIIVGIGPAIRAARARPGEALHDGGRTVARGRHRLRNALVAAQVAASIVLLIAAGLFTRSLAQVQHIDLGFNPSHVLNLSMNLHDAGYSQAQGREFYKELLARVRALPGVRSASLAALIPLGVGENDDAIYIEGQSRVPGRPATRLFDNQVSPGYFEAMQIPILRGRAFTEADNQLAPLVALINQAMAHRFWPNQDALGKRFKVDSESNPWTTVVGIAKDGKYRSVVGATPPYFYLPLAQDYSAVETLEVRTALAPESAAGEIERQIHELAPDLPLFDIQTMEESLNNPYGLLDFHLGAGIAATLGLLGLILAVIGVYGVVSYAASRRTHEIGIRMALGAQPGDIWKMVFKQGLVVVGAGVIAGLLLAGGAARLLSGFLFGVSVYDPLTFAGVAVLLSVVALLACLIPARRVAKVHPMDALRYE
ncbi:MAG: ABC transporter permease [Terriglobia bacterium]